MTLVSGPRFAAVQLRMPACVDAETIREAVRETSRELDCPVTSSRSNKLRPREVQSGIEDCYLLSVVPDTDDLDVSRQVDEAVYKALRQEILAKANEHPELTPFRTLPETLPEGGFTVGNPKKDPYFLNVKPLKTGLFGWGFWIF